VVSWVNIEEAEASLEGWTCMAVGAGGCPLIGCHVMLESFAWV
jgi:hypothetical protein